MENDQNEEPKVEAGSMLNQKTNEDFNKKIPNTKDPELKSVPVEISQEEAPKEEGDKYIRKENPTLMGNENTTEA